MWLSDIPSAGAVAALNATKDLVTHQKTPLRVLHRRTLMVRDKIIHNMKWTPFNAHFGMLQLTTSAGTYVKEFVHGDLGRTVPNVATLLGVSCADILQLDVENVHESGLETSDGAGAGAVAATVTTKT